MCGLVAILTDSPRLNEALLVEMRDRIAHRGPDGSAIWIGNTGSGQVGLAHRRLAIIDLSAAAAQPMFDAEKQVVIVYNGEIYNYLELRAELIASGRKFKTKSDTEVILQAYLHWGPDCLSRLNGMFAFALFDIRSNELFVARDRFGEKPLYFAFPRSGGIAIASEMKALLAHPEIDASLNDEEFLRHLGGGSFEFGEETHFKSIHRLDAAHAMLIDVKGAIRRRWRYWTPNYAETRTNQNAADAADEFIARMRQSVKMRLRSDVPVGSCLSGGLDSSTIVALVSGIEKKGRQHVFSVRFDEDRTMSEGPYIDMIVRRTNAEPHSVTPTPDNLSKDWRAMHWHLEAPSRSGSIYNQYSLMRVAKEAGVTVLLDGQGADEVLGGYQYFFGLRQLDLLHQNRHSELESETASLWWRLRRVARRYPNARRRFDATPGYSLEYLWQRRDSGAQPGEGARREGVPPAANGQLFRRQLALALQYEHLPNLLHTADRSGMAFGREARFPFLDHDLVDWCIGLPDDFMTRDGWLKRVLRDATATVLPKAVRWRVDKLGFAAPQDEWLRSSAKSWAADLLFNGPIVHHSAYERTRLEQLWNDHQARKADTSWQLWQWMSASEWLRMSQEGVWKASSNLQPLPGAATGKKAASART